MSISIKTTAAVNIWFDSDNLWVLLADGRQISIPLSFYPSLLHATEKERNNYIISGGGTGLHWDEIELDLTVGGLLSGNPERTTG